MHYSLATLIVNDQLLHVDLTYCDQESSNGVVCKDLLINYGHMKRTELLFSTLRPILLTLDTIPLHHVGYHDNNRGLLLPN